MANKIVGKANHFDRAIKQRELMFITRLPTMGEAKQPHIKYDSIQQSQAISSTIRNRIVIVTTTKQSTMEPTTTTTTEIPTADDDSHHRCWVCQKNPISYQPQSCDCAIYCKSCAMKMATGGVCKKCKQMYAGMRQMRQPQREGGGCDG